MTDLADVRREYDKGTLDEENLLDDPIKMFQAWLEDAVAFQLSDPSAMTVATVGTNGQPSQRIVLLKQVDNAGFVFFTNLESRKAQDLADNPKISLHFPWHAMERQVKVCGTAARVSLAEATAYFLSRPKGSQMAAWASAQSRPISSRQMLWQKFEEVKHRFSQGDMTLPKFWGGYRVVPHEIEFWQGGENRMHDRFVYQKNDDGSWFTQRLMP
ncbi:MAG: pyridoxamine 5'-phosphate oxidase [Alteromonadaceae bacterium]|nr:pyridoxamine 5'-phosphate oxidase [Alteromonadaceae bacterium]